MWMEGGVSGKTELRSSALNLILRTLEVLLSQTIIGQTDQSSYINAARSAIP